MRTPNGIEIAVLKMPGWVLRVGLAVTMIIVLMTLPLMVAGPVLWVLASRYIRLTEIVVEELGQQCRARQRLEEDQEGHAVMLAERDTRIRALESDLKEALSASTASPRTEYATVYRRVGLHPNAPEFLVLAARRAFRLALHPDRHPRHRRQAHDRFILAEAAFDQIAKLRA